MGESVFLLQIVENNPSRTVATIPAGGPLEADIIELCVKEIVSRGVGLFRSESHVTQDIRDGIRAAFLAIKDQTRFIV